MTKGLIHVYCGDGKGKTTAATGLAVRAAGCGKKVIFAQFMKGNDSGELEAMKLVPGIELMRNSANYGFYNQMSLQEKEKLTAEHNGLLEKICKRINRGECDMLILDEYTYPCRYQLIDREKAAQLITDKPVSMELVITGREPSQLFLDRADYITEMRCIRHPFEKGIEAREGIEY